MMPVLFIGHGSPMNALLDNPYTRSLAALGASLPRPAAVLVVSAHWLAEETLVQCSERPGQIYDFYGFPEELYRLRYEPQGSPEFAREASRIVKGNGVRCTDGWGCDHAAWAVLRHMYPEADVPVFEMSLNMKLDERAHMERARGLAPMRERGVLILGSGNVVHNLRMLGYDPDMEPFPWAADADAEIAALLDAGDIEGLADFTRAGNPGRLAAPTTEHFLPLLYAAALREPGENLTYVHTGIQHGSISMRCCMFARD
ncbi:MAG: 4,5-DOPA dioxygenase extradiol [Spirochaetes bacterium]|nr:MAG: 4,5-DOPA dioxygenase extradiol [Spirochaetota bacterium]